MKLSQVNKIEIIRTRSGAWNASVEAPRSGPWACFRTLEKLLEVLRPKRKAKL